MAAASSSYALLLLMLLTSLPEDLLLDITRRIAATGMFDDIASLQYVSTQFRRLSNDPMVLISVYRFVIWCCMLSHSTGRRLKLQACIQSGNTEAMFTKGNNDFFYNQRREAGLELLLSSANLGFQKSIYLYGMVMLCLGGLCKQEGMKMLSTLMDSLQVSRSMDITDTLRRQTRNRFWSDSYGLATMRELKEMYVRDPCGCNGKTSAYVEMRSGTRGKSDIPANEACVTCFWHNQVYRFFCPYA